MGHRIVAGRFPAGPLRLVGLLLPLLAAACGGTLPANLGPRDGRLAPCPETSNCVHTGDRHPQGTTPLVLAEPWRDADPGALWLAVEEAVAELPRTEIRTLRPGYLHAEATSRVFRFVDDLEVYLDRERGELVVRSASRLGRSDLGVNGARVAALRAGLERRGLVTP